MLTNNSDYKYIRSTLLSDRVTIDGNVYGPRPQKPIARLVDFYYLKEINALYHTDVLEDSVEFSFPLRTSNAFPTPLSELGKYVDGKKLENLDAEGQDVFKYTGGEDPDVERLSEQWENALSTYRQTIDDAHEQRTNSISSAEKTYEDYLKIYEVNLSVINEQISSVQTTFYTTKEQNLSNYHEALSALDKRASDIDEERRKREIELSTWNYLRSALEDEYYDEYIDYFLKYNENIQTHSAGLGEIYTELEDLNQDKRE